MEPVEWRSATAATDYCFDAVPPGPAWPVAGSLSMKSWSWSLCSVPNNENCWRTEYSEPGSFTCPSWPAASVGRPASVAPAYPPAAVLVPWPASLPSAATRPVGCSRFVWLAGALNIPARCLPMKSTGGWAFRDSMFSVFHPCVTRFRSISLFWILKIKSSNLDATDASHWEVPAMRLRRMSVCCPGGSRSLRVP
jgi:hypothetical protein